MNRLLTTILAAVSLSLIALPAFSKIKNNQKDKLSYAIGVQTGKAFKAHKVGLKPKAFAEGLEDAMNGKHYQMSEKQMAAVLTAFRKESIEKFRAQIKYEAAKNAKEGAAFLAANKQKSGVKTAPSGLQYKILKRGHGKAPTLNDEVTVNYRGSLINGKVFDSSYRRGKPVTFPVNKVIKGWQEALTMMKPGAVWMIYIPAKLAYGATGAGGAIGPNETLIFKVNLISVKKSNG